VLSDFRLSFLAICCLVVGMTVPVSAQSTDGPDYAGWDAFLEGVRAEALEKGISPITVSVTLVGLEPLKRAVVLDRKQPEFKQTATTYIDKRVSETRIRVGREMMAEHADLLAEIATRYNVQPRYIVSIWGMETNYGRYPLKNDAIQALATLAFDKRRSSFFRKELMAALQILDEGHIDHANMKGSWAGAMGQSQFMPSSFLAYAMDGDGDGRRDIWTTEADVFASIAHYLAQHGWRNDHRWGVEVSLTPEAEVALANLYEAPPSGCRAMKRHTKRLSLQDWQELGVRRLDGSDLPVANLEASLVQPDGPGGRVFLAYRNFKAILSYNCANLYAISVGKLAEKIQ